MSDDTNAPGQPIGPIEESLRRPLGGFSPSSPNYRPLPALDLPPVAAAERGARRQALGSQPPLRPAPAAAEYPTVPDGVPTPAPMPAYVPQSAPAPRSMPLAMQQMMPPPSPRRRTDSIPVVIEAAGAIFGLFGLGWLYAGRNSTGILLLVGGLFWAAIGVGLLSTGIGAVCFLPVHVAFVALTTVLLSNHIRRYGYS